MHNRTIGKLAREAGVHLETVRYYERRGLLPKPARTESGYRQYGDEDVQRLRFIKRAQALGFSLREIKELLVLRVSPKTSCADIKRRAEAKLADIDDKLQQLRQIKRALKKVHASCNGRGPVSECSILAAFEQQEKQR